MIHAFLITIGIVAVIAEILMILAWISVGFRYKEKKETSYSPTVSIIVPCMDEGIYS